MKQGILEIWDNILPWGICPACEVVVALNEKAINKVPYPDWSDHLDFPAGDAVCTTVCSNCKSVIVVVAEWWVQETGSTENPEYLDSFTIKFIDPAPDLFAVNNSVPNAVREALFGAFKAFWVHRQSATNQLRKVFEVICDHQKIPIFSTTRVKPGKGKERRLLSLYERFKRLTSDEHKKGAYKKLHTYLQAIRHISNWGSHKLEDIPFKDVCSAFEISEAILQELYPQSSVVKKAKDLVSRYKPRKTKVRKH